MNDNRIHLIELARILIQLETLGVPEDVRTKLELAMGKLYGCSFKEAKALDLLCRLMPAIHDISSKWDESMMGECGSKTLTVLHRLYLESRVLLSGIVAESDGLTIHPYPKQDPWIRP